MLSKQQSKKLVLSRVFLLIPILLAIIAFQTKEPVLSNVQVPDLDDNAFIGAFQTDTGHNRIFTAVDVLLVPPGGMDAFIRSIADNYVYPKEAKEANVKGNLSVTFVVERLIGSFSDIKVIEDLGFGTGEEIIRVLESSRRWSPGIQSGRPVRAQYKLLISIGEKIEVVSVSQLLLPATRAPSDIVSEFNNPLFLKVEQPPVPLDGMSVFLKYIGDNYVYSKAAIEAKVSGHVEVTFIVEEDGSLSTIRPIRDLGFGTGEEAVRVLRAGPKWKPGVQNGKVVRVQYTLPIVLNLSK